MSQKNPTIQGEPNLKMTSAKIKVNANQQYQQRPNNSLEEKSKKSLLSAIAIPQAPPAI